MEKEKVEPLLMSKKEAAMRYAISDRTMYTIMHRPDSPMHLKIGGKLLLPIEEWDKFMFNTFDSKKGATA